MAATDVGQRGEEVLPARPYELGEGQEDVLHGEVLVAQRAALLVGSVQGLPQGTAEPRLRPPVGLGQAGDGLRQPVAQRRRGHAHFLEDRQGGGSLLAQHRQQEVLGRHLRMAARPGRLHRRVEGLLGLEGPAIRVQRHGLSHLQVVLRKLDTLYIKFCLATIPGAAGKSWRMCPGRPRPS